MRRAGIAVVATVMVLLCQACVPTGGVPEVTPPEAAVVAAPPPEGSAPAPAAPALKPTHTGESIDGLEQDAFSFLEALARNEWMYADYDLRAWMAQNGETDALKFWLDYNKLSREFRIANGFEFVDFEASYTLESVEATEDMVTLHIGGSVSFLQLNGNGMRTGMGDEHYVTFVKEDGNYKIWDIHDPYDGFEAQYKESGFDYEYELAQRLPGYYDAPEIVREDIQRLAERVEEYLSEC